MQVAYGWGHPPGPGGQRPGDTPQMAAGCRRGASERTTLRVGGQLALALVHYVEVKAEPAGGSVVHPLHKDLVTQPAFAVSIRYVISQLPMSDYGWQAQMSCPRRRGLDGRRTWR